MNKKEDILNAWITIEQLAEGSINKNGKLLKTFHRIEKDWQQFFMNFLYYQKQHNNMSDKAFKKSGIVFYFGIFNFQEVVDILREKYNIEKTYEEISNSEKFTFALYFDHQLNLVADKLFLTMSGYIREHGHLPDDFLKVETLFREELDRKFEEGFH
ncbi:replication ATP-dependent helicase, partial [Bacillus safensis]|nr:replication ATP-dependent helicase [Bacillus safensis]